MQTAQQPQVKQPEAATGPKSDASAQSDFQRLLEKAHRAVSVFESPADFAHAQRVAMMLNKSPMVPVNFRGDINLGNTVIAVDIAFRLKMSPLLVMNQIYIVYGKPGFSAQFAIAVMNTSGDFSKVRYSRRALGKLKVPYAYTVKDDDGNKRKSTGIEEIEDVEVIAWALEGKGAKLPVGVNTLEKARAAGLPILEGPPVSLSLAIKDGWYHRSDSKWKSMPDVMLNYRAATFFGRLYAPELMMGLQTVEEIEDVGGVETPAASVPLFHEKPKSNGAPKEPEEPKLKMASEPASAVEEKPNPADQPAEKTVVAQLKELAANGGIGVGALIDFFVQCGSVQGEPGTLEEIQLSNPDLIKLAVEQWCDIAARIHNTPKQ